MGHFYVKECVRACICCVLGLSLIKQLHGVSTFNWISILDCSTYDIGSLCYSQFIS